MPKMTSYTLFSLHAADGTPLTKSKESSYPLVKFFNSTEHNITSIDSFYEAIQETSDTAGCLLKGNLSRPLVNESRAGSTSPDDYTTWIAFDLDGAPYQTPEDFISDLPDEFQNVSYVTQYSASMGEKPGLRAHLFFQLSSPVYASLLKIYLQKLNFDIPTLNDEIALSSTGVALRWALDISVGQNDKLIYVAPPAYSTPNFDKLKLPRISLTKLRTHTVKLNLSGISKANLDRQIKSKLNKLRKEQKLPTRRKYETAKYEGVEVLVQPGESFMSGHKIERGRHYLNLNGGDSWGYFHPVGQNEILYNFKGEPNYLIKELLPEYYRELTNQAPPKQPGSSSGEPPQGLKYIAICDRKTDMYYRGTFDPNNNVLDIFKTSSMTKVHHFLKSNGAYVPDFIPEWDVICDFNSHTLYDKVNQVLNLYQETDYIKKSVATLSTSPDQTPGQLPPTIHKIIHHVFGYNQVVIDHFMNWIAYIIQTKRMAGTAWILHGTQGTGKGVLFNEILTPIIGKDYAFRTTFPTFEGEFNSFMETSLLILIDEAQVSDLNKKSTAMSNLKQLITDSRVSIRRMRTDPYTVDNHASFIVNSNKHDPMQVDTSDRRWNVSPRQEVPLSHAMDLAEIDKIPDELQDFTTYLMAYKVDTKKVKTVLDTDERHRLQTLTQDSGEEVAEHLREGNLQFFMDNTPDSEDLMAFELKSNISGGAVKNYKEIISLLIKHRNEPINLSRDELRVLYYYTTDLTWPTPHKFTKYAGHKGLKIETVDIKGKSTRGVHGLVFDCNDIEAQKWLKQYDAPKKTRVTRIK